MQEAELFQVVANYCSFYICQLQDLFCSAVLVKVRRNWLLLLVSDNNMHRLLMSVLSQELYHNKTYAC